MEITLRPTLKQHLVNEALRNPEIDTVFFGGGAGGGKSWEICESRLVNALLYPEYRSFIGREELKRLMQSTYITWTKVCAFHKIPKDLWKLNGQYNYIEFGNGSRIDLLDLKYEPSDPFYERLGSTEYTDGAIEEAGEVHFLAYDVLKSRIGRHLNKELGIKPTLLITGNPKKNWTYIEFYKPFKNGTLPKNVAFIQSLYWDNPHTSQEYEKQLMQIKDKVMKERLMNGNWEYDIGDNALMNFDAINDLFTNKVEENGEKFLIVDVAREGKDKTIFHYWKGKNLFKREEFSKQAVDETAEKIKWAAMYEYIPYSHILVDEDGIGGGVVDIVRGVKGFHANSKSLQNKETQKPSNYQNLKTQCAYKLAEEVNEHRIRIEIDDIVIREKIMEELEQIKSKDKDKDGKLKIVPKDEVKEIIGRSPDDSDCLLMRMLFDLKPYMAYESTIKTYVPENISKIHTYIPHHLKR